MSDTAHSAPSPAGLTLRLARCGARDPGNALMLRRDDILIGIDGKPWTGSAEALAAHVAAANRPVAMTFLRKDAAFTVLTARTDLAPWEPVATPAPLPALPADPSRLANWELLEGPDGRFEPVPMRPSTLALVLPPLWLAQMRMWTWLATLGAALAIALVGGAPLALVVWLAAGVHLWRTGAAHLVADRVTAGFTRRGLLAAASEAEACKAWASLNPGARFRFDPEPAAGQADPSATATPA